MRHLGFLLLSRRHRRPCKPSLRSPSPEARWAGRGRIYRSIVRFASYRHSIGFGLDLGVGPDLDLDLDPGFGSSCWVLRLAGVGRSGLVARNCNCNFDWDWDWNRDWDWDWDGD